MRPLWGVSLVGRRRRPPPVLGTRPYNIRICRLLPVFADAVVLAAAFVPHHPRSFSDSPSCAAAGAPLSCLSSSSLAAGRAHHPCCCSFLGPPPAAFPAPRFTMLVTPSCVGRPKHRPDTAAQRPQPGVGRRIADAARRGARQRSRQAHGLSIAAAVHNERPLALQLWHSSLLARRCRFCQRVSATKQRSVASRRRTEAASFFPPPHISSIVLTDTTGRSGAAVQVWIVA